MSPRLPQNCARRTCGHTQGLHQTTLNRAAPDELGRCWACACEQFIEPAVCTSCGHEPHDKPCVRLVVVPQELRDPYRALASKLCGCMLITQEK